MDTTHKETANRGHVFGTSSGGLDDWADAEVLALYGCDPIAYAQSTRPARSTEGREPLRPNYIPKRRRGKLSLIEMTRSSRHRDFNEQIDALLEEEKAGLNV